MPIPPAHKNRFIYHFSHLDNLHTIIRNGIWCHKKLEQQGQAHKSIALDEIQKRRAKMQVTCGPGGVVHDYVPFYFCARSSMLLSVVNAKNVDQLFIIYLVLPVSAVLRKDIVFTSAAANTANPPKFFNDPSQLNSLKWDAIDSKKWSMSDEVLKQARMAEVLIHQEVKISEVSHIIVWNDAVKKRVEEIFEAEKMQPPKVVLDGHNGTYHYFTNFYEGGKKSIVTGPFFTKRAYEDTVKHIRETGQNASAPHKNIAALLNALRADFNCLPETAELHGLKSDNVMHKEDAGTHTLSVVSELRKLPEFNQLNDADKRLTELAAFLHDIGKGPKSRWANNGGIQKADPDHPIGSGKMLRRILTLGITTIKPRSIRVLAKLVCYHDLIGDIVAKGRDPEHLEDIADSERELDMLIALNLADTKAISEGWFVRLLREVKPLRARVLAKLNATSAEEDE
jgi:hypothetical protein